MLVHRNRTGGIVASGLIQHSIGGHARQPLRRRARGVRPTNSLRGRDNACRSHPFRIKSANCTDLARRVQCAPQLFGSGREQPAKASIARTFLEPVPRLLFSCILGVFFTTRYISLNNQMEQDANALVFRLTAPLS